MGMKNFANTSPLIGTTIDIDKTVVIYTEDIIESIWKLEELDFCPLLSLRGFIVEIMLLQADGKKILVQKPESIAHFFV